MRKPSKMVEREELDACKADKFRIEMALAAALDGRLSKGYTIPEPHYPGNSYTFRFLAMANGYDIAVSTFRCTTTGQRDSTHVYCVDAVLGMMQRYYGMWEQCFDQAYRAWMRDRSEVAKCA